MKIKNSQLGSSFFWLGLMILVLLIFNIVTIIIILNNRKINQEFRFTILKEQIKNKEKGDIIMKDMELQLFLNSTLNHKVSDSLQIHKGKVLLIFNGDGCKQCILSIVMDLNKLGEKIGKENIILIGDFKTKTDLDSYLLDINDGFGNILFNDIFNVGVVEIDKPTLVLLDTNYNIKFVFYNPEQEPETKKMYFDKFIVTYFNDLKLSQN